MPHSDQVTRESGGAQVRKRAREHSPHAPSKQAMVSDLCIWAEYDVQSATTWKIL